MAEENKKRFPLWIYPETHQEEIVKLKSRLQTKIKTQQQHVFFKIRDGVTLFGELWYGSQ